MSERAILGTVTVLAVLLPVYPWIADAPPWLTLALAFLAGTVLERYRQGRRRRPLGIGERPRVWLAAARDSIGAPASIVATLAGAGALLFLLMPALTPTKAPLPPTTIRQAVPPRPSGKRSPSLRVLHQRQGTAFVVAAASFRIERLMHSAGAGVDRPAAYKPVAISVEGENLGRRNFNPNHLSYRLLDRLGNLYYPESIAGTGPASLSRTGSLEAGQAASVHLHFSVPRSAQRLTLIFEPVADGSAQVQVSLGTEG